MRTHAVHGEPHPPDAFVFGTATAESIASIRTAWQRTCARAGITGLHFHDLRREAASRLLESGADIATVSSLLGHGSVVTTSTYLRSTSPRLERALARMAETVFAQHSDKHDSEALAEAPEPAVENRANVLN